MHPGFLFFTFYFSVFMHFSNKFTSYIIAAFCLIATIVTGQLGGVGQPEIINYTKQSYGGGTQSWAITSGFRNAILVANNDGLLIFDGHNWRKNYLPNRTIARSVWYDPTTRRIYTGGQDEVGYFSSDKTTGYAYQSIKESIPAQYNILEDVWDMAMVNEKLYFRSLHRIFQFDVKIWKIFPAKNITSLSILSNVVIFNDLEEGLYIINESGRHYVKGSDIFRKIPIIKVVESGPDDWVVFTEKEGIYSYKNSKWSKIESKESGFLQKNRVHSACKLSEGHIAAGTHLGGIVILNKALQAINLLDKKRECRTIQSVPCIRTGKVISGQVPTTALIV